MSAPKVDPRRETNVFKKMASARSEERPRDRAEPGRHAANKPTERDYHTSRSNVRRTNNNTSSKFTTSIDDFEPLQPSIKEETPAYLIKRRQRKEEEEKRKAKEKKASVVVPTFII
jgi:hypothetical protein